jgi:hypothetical protein
MLSPIDENNEFGLDATAQAHLLETVRWTKFLAIVGFIFMGLALLLVICMIAGAPMLSHYKASMGQPVGTNPFNTLGMIGVGIIYFIFVCLYFYPVYALLKFSSCIKKGIQDRDQHYLNMGFRYQKNLYIYIGVLTIISLIADLVLLLFFGIAIMAGR